MGFDKSKFGFNAFLLATIFFILVLSSVAFAQEENNGIGPYCVDDYCFDCPPVELCENPVLINFNELLNGTVVVTQYGSLGMTVSAINDNSNSSHPDKAIIFDSAFPTGGDTDLGTPNQAFGGPGIGTGANAGAGNDENLFKLLIISENNIDSDHDGRIDVPDDEAQGGKLVFDFNSPVLLNSLKFVDIEETGGKVKAFNGATQIFSINIPKLGDNSVEQLNSTRTDYSATKLVVDLAASGAIDDLVLCGVPACGNGIKESGEECDGNAGVGAHQVCTNNCRLNNLTYCGDGIKQRPNQEQAGGPNNDGYEQCDINAGVGEHQVCTQNCTLESVPYCGDGIKNQQSEQCDGSDGTTEHYTCTDACLLEYVPYCGDQIKNGNEQCDGTDGLPNEHYSCTDTCELQYIPYCGDGVKNGNEECDGTDGVGPHQTCSQECQLNNLTYCGDETKQTPNDEHTGGPNNDGFEECDTNDGTPDHYRCTEECTLIPVPYCGDGVKNGSEECDGSDGVPYGYLCTQECHLEQEPACRDIEIGDFCSQTQGGWGTACHGNNPGCLRDNNWNTVIGGNLLVGLGNTLTFSGPSAVENFLPQGGTPSVLTNSYVNPTGTEAGVFGGQVTALKLNVLFSAAGIGLQTPNDPMPIGQLRIASGPFEGLTVGEFLELAEKVLGGNTFVLAPFNATVSDASDAATAINENFDDCRTNNGFLIRPACVEPYCGDGVVNQLSEQCDGSDGVTEHYTCTDVCLLEYVPYCGDGTINQASEECDGTAGVGPNQVCTAQCQLENIPFCGDGIKNGNEECDGADGIPNEHYICTTECTLQYMPYCGDGTINQEWEACDGTAGVPEHYSCTQNCQLQYQPYCGDGIINQETEQCDGTTGVGPHQTCSQECQLNNLTYCGDETKQTPNDEHTGGPNNDGFEECDTNDGTPDHYRCTEECTLIPVPYCGDGVVNQPEEQCDGTEGLPNEHYSCTDHCDLQYIPYCGDGIINQQTEQCDGTDGVGEHQTCSQNCTLNNLTYCGDETKQTPNDEHTGGPNNDGFEECDGNDGVGEHQLCTSNCTLEDIPYCGDGIVNQTWEQCDGSAPEHYTCTTQCTLQYTPYCGDGTINQETEQCDDGNLDNGDGCSGECTLECGPPNTIKTYGEPIVHSEGSEWISSLTPISFSTVSQLPDGICESNTSTYYRITLVDDTYCRNQSACLELNGNGEWISYTGGEIHVPDQSCHLIEFFSETNGQREAKKQQCAFVNNTGPEVRKGFFEPHLTRWVEDHNVEYMSQRLPIMIACYDSQPHPAPNDSLCFKVTQNNEDVTQEYCDWWYAKMNPEGYCCSEDAYFYFKEDSWHTLDLYCEDGLGNAGAHDFEYFAVDTVPPVITKTVVGPNSGQCPPAQDSNDVCMVNMDTVIHVDAIDPEPHPAGEVTCTWDYLVIDTNATGGSTEKLVPPFDIMFSEQSQHQLSITCTDALNNSVTDTETFFVDTTPPIGIKTVGTPKEVWTPGQNGDASSMFYPEINHTCWATENGIECWKVTLVTPITMDCNDQQPHPAGHEEIHFIVGLDGDDATEKYCNNYGGTMANDWCVLPTNEKTIFFLEETEHNLKYYCVDAVGNAGPVDDEKFKVEGTGFEIQLNKKWNLVSIPFALKNDDIVGTLDSIDENIDSVWSYDGVTDTWFVYRPSNPLASNLETLEPGKGYWVAMLNKDLLKIDGSLFSPATTPPSVELSHGWNLIGYYGTENLPGYYGPQGFGRTAKCELYSLGNSNTDLGWTSLWTYWELDNPSQKHYFGQGNRLDPGAGYWVLTTEESVYGYATTCGGP